ncbi:uncharacterized protein L203_106280 [Cryptococcus depauperatus CBS 7841]|uniref:Transcription factor domain-containing protein n=1 Tax=Cryptococcus depauperatus CBS 7841 TaxID=1295531 RepID=A0AAJ8M4B1_9TREE
MAIGICEFKSVLSSSQNAEKVIPSASLGEHNSSMHERSSKRKRQQRTENEREETRLAVMKGMAKKRAWRESWAKLMCVRPWTASQAWRCMSEVSSKETAQMEEDCDEQRPLNSSYASSMSLGLGTPCHPIGQDNGLVFIGESFHDHPTSVLPSPDPQSLFSHPSLRLSHDMPMSSSPALLDPPSKLKWQGEVNDFVAWQWPSRGLGLYDWSSQPIDPSVLAEEASPSAPTTVTQSPYMTQRIQTSGKHYWSPTAAPQGILVNHDMDHVEQSTVDSHGNMIDHAGPRVDSDGMNTLLSINYAFSASSSYPNSAVERETRSQSNQEVPLFDTEARSLYLQQSISSGKNSLLLPPRDRLLTEKDITQSARNYLLDLFFYSDPPRNQFGSEPFTQTQFYSKLLLPPEQQPHPALLFSMYTLAASVSYIPAIRYLAESLFEITKQKLDDGIRTGDRLVDIINGSKNISKWLYERGRLLEGYEWASRSISLCLACKLHEIPSSVFIEPGEDTVDENAPLKELLPPPKDQWELCERIHAFWGVWGNEKGGTLRTGWPSMIKDEVIITPLPRPPEDYLNRTISKVQDINFRDLYDLPFRQNSEGLDFIYGLLFSVAHLHHRARTLSSHISETSPSYRSLDSTVQSPVRKRYPGAFDDILRTCEWLEEHIPSQWRLDGEGEGWSHVDVPVLYSLLKSIPIYLYSPSDPSDRPLFIQHTRVAANIVLECLKRLQTESNGREYRMTGQGSAGSRRNKNGLSGPYRFCQWLTIENKLSQCAILLEEEGNLEEAKQCRRDAEVILEGYQSVKPSPY